MCDLYHSRLVWSIRVPSILLPNILVLYLHYGIILFLFAVVLLRSTTYSGPSQHSKFMGTANSL